MSEAPSNEVQSSGAPAPKFRQVACGYSSCCAIKTEINSGEVICWGGLGGLAGAEPPLTQQDLTTPPKKDNGEYIMYSDIAATMFSYCAVSFMCVSAHAHPRPIARLQTAPLCPLFCSCPLPRRTHGRGVAA